MKFVQKNYEATYGRNPNASSYGEPTDVVLHMLDLLPSGASVLDAGGGDARNAIPAAKLGHDVTVVDLSPEGLAKGRRLAEAQGCRIRTIEADLEAWRFDHDYDAVICAVTLQYLPALSARRFLDEARERTRPAGFHALTLFTSTGARMRLDREGEDDRDAFYPEDGWIGDFYLGHGWTIVSYLSTQGKLMGRFEADGTTPLTSVVERILVRKPA